jgi:hypothetical protein
MVDETGTEGQAADTAATPDYNVEISIPHSSTGEGQPDRKVTVDLSAVPGEARLELLKSATRTFVTNRVNVANVRQNKLLAPWLAYDAAMAADPLQTTVAKPAGDRPAALDTYAKAQEAIADLLRGEVRQQARKGEGRSRAPRDPLVAAVTPIVTRAVFEANKARGATVAVEGKPARAYTYPDAVKEVGGDGIAYLNRQIDAKVAAAPADQQAKLRADLEKNRDSRYIDPARTMIGAKLTKAQTDLPSIL